MRIHIIVISLFLLSACSTIKPRPISLNSSHKEAIDNAKICNNVATPTITDTFDWKYGCFCGKNFPKIRVESRSKDSIKIDYLSIKPKDSIDEACQQHDLCWLDYGDNNGGCNDNLKVRMKELMNIYFKFNNPDPKIDDACFTVANDVLLAFSLIVVPSDFDNKNEETLKEFRNMTVGTLATIFGFGRRVLRPKYPSEKELCTDFDYEKFLYRLRNG